MKKIFTLDKLITDQVERVIRQLLSLNEKFNFTEEEIFLLAASLNMIKNPGTNSNKEEIHISGKSRSYGTDYDFRIQINSNKIYFHNHQHTTDVEGTYNNWTNGYTVPSELNSFDNSELINRKKSIMKAFEDANDIIQSPNQKNISITSDYESKTNKKLTPKTKTRNEKRIDRIK